MSNVASIKKRFENSNQNLDAIPPPVIDTRLQRPVIRSPPRPLLDEIVARKGRTSPSRESTETQSPQRPIINSSHRLPVFSDPRDELSKLKEDIQTVNSTLSNVQDMLFNMYTRIATLETRQSAQHPTRPYHPPFHNPSQPIQPPASYSSSVSDPVMRGGSLEEKYIKYKSKYNKLKNKLI
jgi:hypothetical protein